MTTKTRTSLRRFRRLALAGVVASGLLTGLVPGLPTPVAAAATSDPAGYQPLEPHRVCDTRPSTEPDTDENQCNDEDGEGKLGVAGKITVDVTTDDGVPDTAEAVVLNVTATRGTAPSFLTVYPAGTTRPTASNLNFIAGQTVPNLVQVQLGTGANAGKVEIYNGAGSVDVIVDVQGYFDADLDEGPGEFNPVKPARICDTRVGTGIGPNVCNNNGAAQQLLGAGQERDLKVTGKGNIPTTNVAAVVLNVTVTSTSAASYLTVYPFDADRPTASNLNWVAGQTVPNRVVVPLGDSDDDGELDSITIYNNKGTTNVIVDVAGWYSAEESGGFLYVAHEPKRICDTRTEALSGSQIPNNPCNNDGTFTGRLGGPDAETVDSLIAEDAKAIVINTTAVGSTAASHLRVWDQGALPTISDLNWPAGRTVANLVVVKVADNKTFRIYNNAGAVDVITDLQGYYVPAPL